MNNNLCIDLNESLIVMIYLSTAHHVDGCVYVEAIIRGHCLETCFHMRGPWASEQRGRGQRQQLQPRNKSEIS
jgi:hypothetical protein